MRIVHDATREERGVALEQPMDRPDRLLVVDADEGLARTLRAILRHDGHEVTATTTIGEAKDLLRADPFDLVLIDLSMREAGVVDALETVRALAPGATVVALTRYASYDTAMRALRAGAYDYVVKPVDIEELRITVERALERRLLERELAARVGDLEVAQTQLRGFNTALRAQVDEATAELRRKVLELDNANAQLRQTQEEHERFVAMVAHEMRGPLNPIINYAQITKRPNITPQQIDAYTDIIIEHAFRLNRLVDDLQTATRLSTGQFSLERARCDLAEALSEVIAHFTATIHDRRFSLTRPEGPVYAIVDKDRILQAARNLLDNAVKYSADGGAVDVSVWNDERTAYIRVQDYGAGIPEPEMARIFEAFTRLEKRPEVNGSGLGLFITRGIVSAHGGSLEVRNGSGTERARGAIFTIGLPIEIPAPANADHDAAATG
ncbi:MAG TPA: ATP-binding protein [Ktedonobacterales bacterium]|nr:ATP-binding protein [Ktedonobacterales bacterium]